MIITREELSVELINFIHPYLVFHPGDGQDIRTRFTKQLVSHYQNSPETLLFLVARDEKAIIGFLIARSEEDHVFISQAWSKPGNPFKVTDELFLRTLIWAVGLGKSSVRAETRRSIDAMHRRVGFVERCMVVERKIDDELMNAVMSHAREVVHGRVI